LNKEKNEALRVLHWSCRQTLTHKLLVSVKNAVHLLAQPTTDHFKAVSEIYLFMQLKVTNYSLLLFCCSVWSKHQ